MIIFVIIIAAIVVWYCISAEKERIAKQKAQQNQKKVQDELAAKVKEAEALIPRAASSDFYREISSYIRSEISKRDQSIRNKVARDYNAWLSSNSSKPFVPDYKKYDEDSCDYGSIRLSNSYIYGFSVDPEFYPPSIVFSSQGYADLTATQLYALLQSLRHSFDSLEPYKNSKYFEKSLTVKQLQSEIFENNSTFFYLFMTDCHIKSIVDSEVQRLQGQKSPYKNVF